ncbi:hypothetical protein Ocin01_15132 [Orchesella cincta]|uniref:Lysosomal-associated transmembrane protein 4B n=1 Tax=Orchesella cincta TaxID=48709 RepID=A0A1D2MEY3_ORCCI|nr:hypothetical protein Ocin01_15132 [Orchesella cincta]
MTLQLMLEPCPCTSLVKAVKVLAIADIVWCLLNIIMISFVLVDLYHPGTLYPEFKEMTRKIGKPVSFLSLSIYILGIFLAIGLYFGAKKKNAGLCCLWLVFSAVDLVFSLVIAILQVPLYTNKAPEVAVASFLIFGAVAIHIYILLVVLSLIIQICEEKRLQGSAGDEAQPKSSSKNLEAGDYPGEQPDLLEESLPVVSSSFVEV